MYDAETAVLGVFLDRNRALATEFLEHQDEEPAQWRDTMELANSDYWLTSGNSRKFQQRYDASSNPTSNAGVVPGRTGAGGSG